MELSPEERARRKLEMRPPEPRKDPEPETPKPKAPELKPELEHVLTPEQRAKKALGLQPHDPMPDPKDLSPQMQQALSKLDPKFQVQVMGVMGCLQQFQEKTQALSERIQQNMGSAIERTKQTSLAQRAIIRRAQKGTLGQKDVDMARGIIAEQGARGAIDPKREGLTELLHQREELVGAATEMRALLMEQMPEGIEGQDSEKAQALAVVDTTLAQQASVVSHTVDQAWGGYKQSDLQRIQLIVEGQTTTQLDQAATHRPQGR